MNCRIVRNAFVTARMIWRVSTEAFEWPCFPDEVKNFIVFSFLFLNRFEMLRTMF